MYPFYGYAYGRNAPYGGFVQTPTAPIRFYSGFGGYTPYPYPWF